MEMPKQSYNNCDYILHFFVEKIPDVYEPYEGTQWSYFFVPTQRMLDCSESRELLQQNVTAVSHNSQWCCLCCGVNHSDRLLDDHWLGFGQEQQLLTVPLYCVQLPSFEKPLMISGSLWVGRGSPNRGLHFKSWEIHYHLRSQPADVRLSWSDVQSDGRPSLPWSWFLLIMEVRESGVLLWPDKQLVMSKPTK